MFDDYSNGDLLDFQEVFGFGKIEEKSQIYRKTLNEVTKFDQKN